MPAPTPSDLFVPEIMTDEQERKVERLTQRLESAGWSKDLIIRWFQTGAKELNGFCPLEAICADKLDLADLCLEKTLRLYEKAINKYQDEEIAQYVKEF